jgi:hypothetical protein
VPELGPGVTGDTLGTAEAWLRRQATVRSHTDEIAAVTNIHPMSAAQEKVESVVPDGFCGGGHMFVSGKAASTASAHLRQCGSVVHSAHLPLHGMSDR